MERVDDKLIGKVHSARCLTYIGSNMSHHDILWMDCETYRKNEAPITLFSRGDESSQAFFRRQLFPEAKNDP